MSKVVILGTSHLAHPHNEVVDTWFEESFNISIAGFGVDTYFMRLVNFLENNKGNFTFLIEIPYPGRYQEFVNESNYDSNDFLKNNFWKEGVKHPFVFFYSKIQEIKNFNVINKQTRYKQDNMITTREIKSISKLKLFNNTKLEIDDIHSKCVVIDQFLKNQGHVVNWISINGSIDGSKWLQKYLHVFTDIDLHNYLKDLRKIPRDDHDLFKKKITHDGSHYTTKIWNSLYEKVIRKEMKYA